MGFILVRLIILVNSQTNCVALLSLILFAPMPASPLTTSQLAEAAQLKKLFVQWQHKRREEGQPASQEVAGDLLGFGQSALSQYLNGKIPLNVDAAVRLADLIGCAVADFSDSLAAEVSRLTTAAGQRPSEVTHLRAIARSAPSENPIGGGMHPQMARLYEAAEKIKGITGQSAAARLLAVTPECLCNWEVRGVSPEGMLDAQEILGCNAVWLRKGIGPMLLDGPVAPQLADALKLTTETALEFQLLTVHRFSNHENQAFIETAVDVARQKLDFRRFFNQS